MSESTTTAAAPPPVGKVVRIAGVLPDNAKGGKYGVFNGYWDGKRWFTATSREHPEKREILNTGAWQPLDHRPTHISMAAGMTMLAPGRNLVFEPSALMSRVEWIQSRVVALHGEIGRLLEGGDCHQEIESLAAEMAETLSILTE